MSIAKACGVEPYDKHYGLGYEVGRDPISPYDRVNKAMKMYYDTDFVINSQRAMLVTEAYKKHEGEPQDIIVARALESVLLNMDIDIFEGELIVGQTSPGFKSAPIYPEFSYEWIMDEMENFPFEERSHDIYKIDDKTKSELKSIEEYWKGKTVSEEIANNMTWEQKKGSNLGRGLYLLNLYYFGGIGHFCADYAMLLEKGYGGIKKEVHENMAKTDDKDKQIQYEAMLIVLDASTKFIQRYAKLAMDKASKESNDARKKELVKMAENCNQIASGPALDTWQALQLFHFATQILLIESNGHSVSYGRMDQWLNPYYEKDIEKGTFKKEFIQELLEMTYVKMNTNCKLRDKMTVISNTGRGWGGESLTVGGVDRNGEDATNDLTFMLTDASIHTRMMVPWLCIRMHEKTPYELKVKVAEAIRAGYGHPKVYNDQAAIPAELAKGLSLEDARDYAIVGCVEIDIPGKEYGWHDAAYMNIAKVFEMAVNDGRCISCSDACPMHPVCGGAGTKLGSSTGSIATFEKFDDLLKSYDKQMKYWTDVMAEGIEIMDKTHQKMKPTPYVSTLFVDCIESGIDISRGGVKINHTGPQANGIGTVADGMAVVKQLVFDEGKTTGQELLDAANNNWEGYDALYALVNGDKVHHYGNDDDYADELAKYAFDTFCKHIENRTNCRGGKYTPGVYSVSANVGLGLIQAASIEGRKAFEPISDNMGPVHTYGASHDLNGPTAIANSVSKLNHERATNGTLLNWKFPPECVSGETGRDNLINLIDVFFDKKGMQSQFNIMSSKMMRAALKNPEDYKDMLVRVAGYSAYFVDLSEPLQMDLIGRTELSFE